MKLIIACISIVFFMSGCTDNADTKVFKIGTNLWPGYEALYLAKEEQLYVEDIKITTYDSATVVLNKFRNKEIDAAALTLDEVILLQDQGYNPIIIAVLDISNGADVLIAKKSIESLSDLKDKSIGVENTALGSYILTRILEKASLSYEDITLVPLVLNRHEEAFKEDVVDAVITFEPIRSALLRAGGVEIFSSKDIPAEIVDVLVVQEDMKNTKFVKDILQGWSQSVLKINQRDAKAIGFISSRLGQSEKEFLDSLKGLKIPSLEESNTLILDGSLQSTVNKISDIMLSRNLIKSNVDAKKLF